MNPTSANLLVIFCYFKPKVKGAKKFGANEPRRAAKINVTSKQWKDEQMDQRIDPPVPQRMNAPEEALRINQRKEKMKTNRKEQWTSRFTCFV